MSPFIKNLVFILLGISILAPFTCISSSLDYFSNIYPLPLYFLSNLPANVSSLLISIASLYT